MTKAWSKTIAAGIVRAIAAATLIAVPAYAQAEEFGDANLGRDFAEEMCIDCHAVRAESTVSPRLDAPAFNEIARMPSTTRTALTAWFQTPHPTMPNLILSAEDVDNVIAYILSLKDDG